MDTKQPQALRLERQTFDEWSEDTTILRQGCLLLCRNGVAQFTQNFTTTTLRSGAVVTTFPGDAVMLNERSDDFEAEGLFFDEDLLREASIQVEESIYERLHSHAVRNDFPALSTMVSHLFGVLHFFFDQEDCHCLNEIVLLQLKSHFIGFHDFLLHHPDFAVEERRPAPSQLLFGRFMQLLERSGNHARNVSDYASALGVTPKHLGFVCKQKTTHTAKELIDEYMLSQVKWQLRHSHTSLKELAWQYHFPSVSFFGRYFKRLTGLTPQEFRG